MLKIEIADSKGLVQVGNVHSVIFFVRRARSSKPVG
jgi:hypothetical protein